MTNQVAKNSLATPIGRIVVEASGRGITHVQLETSANLPEENLGPCDATSRAYVEAGLRALDEYFAGRRRAFDDLTLCPSGTRFQLAVWNALEAIGYGETKSYGQIAAAVGDRGAARAVGSANNRNPIMIIVPCHRVIGADGKLVGFGGGIEAKRWLLEHEGATPLGLFSGAAAG